MMTNPKRCRLIFADDHPFIRLGLRSDLRRADWLSVVAECQDGPETLQAVALHRPDLLLLDLHMPRTEPGELLGQLNRDFPELKILVFSAHCGAEEMRWVERARISGFVLKDELTESLQQALRAVFEGASWWSRAVGQTLMERRSQRHNSALRALSPREVLIFRAIGEGKDNRSIAREFHLSEQTVRNYVSTIYQKVGVNSRISATLLSLQQDWSSVTRGAVAQADA